MIKLIYYNDGRNKEGYSKDNIFYTKAILVVRGTKPFNIGSTQSFYHRLGSLAQPAFSA